jgi:hypothetical protein
MPPWILDRKVGGVYTAPIVLGVNNSVKLRWGDAFAHHIHARAFTACGSMVLSSSCVQVFPRSARKNLNSKNIEHRSAEG